MTKYYYPSMFNNHSKTLFKKKSILLTENIFQHFFDFSNILLNNFSLTCLQNYNQHSLRSEPKIVIIC